MTHGGGEKEDLQAPRILFKRSAACSGRGRKDYRVIEVQLMHKVVSVALLSMCLQVLYPSAASGSTALEIEQLLTGSASRAWIAGPTEQSPSTDIFCQANAATYTFSVTGNVAIARCDGRRLVVTDRRWQVAFRQDDIFLIITNEDTYRLTAFNRLDRHQILRLAPIGETPGHFSLMLTFNND